jgi:selenocysteine lyase/cysteine desulfurase
LPPRPAWEALQEALAEWRVGRVSWRKWDASIDVARGAFARLIGAAPQDVAVGSTVAAALAVVVSSLPEGTTVLVDDVEFTSNVFPWQVHADRGVRVFAAPTDELVAAIRPGIDVVAVSAVQSAAGTVLDLPSVIAACAEVGARIILDASQAAGWLPLDASQVDVLVAHSYKFLMCPRGATFCSSPRACARGCGRCTQAGTPLRTTPSPTTGPRWISQPTPEATTSHLPGSASSRPPRHSS